MTFVLIRTKDRKYVARWGLGRVTSSSYTKRLEEAQVFSTRAEAETNRCPESERVVDVDTLVGGGP